MFKNGITLMLVAAMLAVTACSKGGHDHSKVETSELQSSFKEAPAPQQSAVEQAVSSIQSGDYEAALQKLQKLADENLTDAQKQAVKDAIHQLTDVIKAKASEALNEAKEKLKEEASKKIEGLEL